MTTKPKMNQAEKSLLLHLETRIVEYSGRLDRRCLDDEDTEILNRWTKAEFISTGRICSHDATENSSQWVTFSDEAWAQDHELRRQRGERLWKKRNYEITKDKY